MGFNVSIYRISDDNRCMTKTLTNQNRVVQYTDIKFKEGRSLQEIDLTIKENNTSTVQAITRANYCAVYATGVSGYRNTFYFIEGPIKILPTGFITIHLREDVLFTFATQLKDLTCTLDRSETIFNGYLPDSEYSALGYRTIAAKMFPNGLTNDNCILITTG